MKFKEILYDYIFDSVNWAIKDFCENELNTNEFEITKLEIHYNGPEEKNKYLDSIIKEFKTNGKPYYVMCYEQGYWFYTIEDNEKEFITFYKLTEFIKNDEN